MDKFSWKISKRDRGTPWGILGVIGMVTFSISAYLLYSNNYFGGALFIISPIVLLIVSTQGQKEFLCDISDSGINVNNKFYPLKELVFFSIIVDSLIIKPKDAEVVYLPINPDDSEAIRKSLSETLKEEDYEEDFGQIINRFLRIQ